MRLHTLPSILLATLLLSPALQAATDLATVKERLYTYSLSAPAQPRDLSASAAAYMKSLNPDGAWPDVDYKDATPSYWKTSVHTRRLLAMARAYRTPNHLLSSDPALKSKILCAYDGWIRLNPRNPNWWHNQIGEPLTIGAFLVLMEKDLTPAQLDSGLAILRRSTWKTWTGENLVWGVSIQIVRGCLENSAPTVSEAYARMYQEIRIAPAGKEGIQADYSFHQHGPLLYSGGYGHGFTLDCARLMEWAAGTVFAPSPEKRKILESYVLDGQRWMTWGGIYDYSVIGREITRPGKNARGLALAAEQLARLSPDRAPEFLHFARSLHGQGSPTAISGNRHFWCSDYMSHRRTDWFASVRMYSAHLLNTDGYINAENKKSHHLSDGATLLYQTGREYADIFPAWNWLRIPGTTCEQNTPLVPQRVNHRGATTFVDGASDGRYGLAAMHLATDQLRARKAWAFFDDEYVCLGAGITCPTDNPVYTSIEQCLLTGDVRTSTQDQPLPSGDRMLKDLRWAHHASTAYLFPQGGAVAIANQPQSGNWSDIGASSGRITRDVFSLYINHGPHPTNATYAYIVLPQTTPASLQSRLANNPIQILSNTPDVQAVYHTRLNRLAAVFHTPATLTTPVGALSVNHPCLLLLSTENRTPTITVSTPADKPVTLHVTLKPTAPAPTQTLDIHLPHPTQSTTAPFRK